MCLDDAKIKEQVNAILFILFPTYYSVVTSLPALCIIYMQVVTKTIIIYIYTTIEPRL